jgi:hypothetical protein
VVRFVFGQMHWRLPSNKVQTVLILANNPMSFCFSQQWLGQAAAVSVKN